MQKTKKNQLFWLSETLHCLIKEIWPITCHFYKILFQNSNVRSSWRYTGEAKVTQYVQIFDGSKQRKMQEKYKKIYNCTLIVRNTPLLKNKEIWPMTCHDCKILFQNSNIRSSLRYTAEGKVKENGNCHLNYYLWCEFISQASGPENQLT